MDHLVHTVPQEMCVERAPHDSDERYAKRLAELKYTRITFDWQAAQAAIDSVVGATSSGPSSSSWVYVDSDLEASSGSLASPDASPPAALAAAVLHMSTAGSPKQPVAEVVLPSGTMPLTPPMSFSDSCFAPTDIRFVPPLEGYNTPAGRIPTERYM